MLKALGIFVRLVCSLVVLFAVALYLQMNACSPGNAVAPDQFMDGVTLEAVAGFFTSLNWVSIAAGALVLCALLRLLDMAWNVAFCLSMVLVLFCGLWAVWGPVVALPSPLQGNSCMIQLCTLPQDYPVPAIIVMGAFAMGWLAATSPFRIAFTTLVSFGLWYGITCLMHWAIVAHWADTPTPAQPEMLAMVLANPWLIAALPGAFFLVYAVLAAFFETFLASAKKKESPKAEEKPAEEKKEEPKPEAKPEAKPMLSPAPKPAAAKVVKPVLKPATKPAAAPAPKAEATPEPPPATEEKTETTPEEKPAVKAEKQPEPKAEEKPEAKAEEKSAEQTAVKAAEKPASPEEKKAE